MKLKAPRQRLWPRRICPLALLPRMKSSHATEAALQTAGRASQLVPAPSRNALLPESTTSKTATIGPVSLTPLNPLPKAETTTSWTPPPHTITPNAWGELRFSREDSMNISLAKSLLAAGQIDEAQATRIAAPWHEKGVLVGPVWVEKYLDPKLKETRFEIMSLGKAKKIQARRDAKEGKWLEDWEAGLIDDEGNKIVRSSDDEEAVPEKAEKDVNMETQDEDVELLPPPQTPVKKLSTKKGKAKVVPLPTITEESPEKQLSPRILLISPEKPTSSVSPPPKSPSALAKQTTAPVLQSSHPKSSPKTNSSAEQAGVTDTKASRKRSRENSSDEERAPKKTKKTKV
jgi:hypothetical protein